MLQVLVAIGWVGRPGHCGSILGSVAEQRASRPVPRPLSTEFGIAGALVLVTRANYQYI